MRPASVACLILNAIPFLQGLSKHRGAPPTVIVIFGASGDLTARKLIPAIYNLSHDNLLPPDFYLVGFGRKPVPDEEFRGHAEAAIREFSRRELNPDAWSRVARNTFYLARRLRRARRVRPPPRAHPEARDAGRPRAAVAVLHLHAALGLPADPREPRGLGPGAAPPRLAAAVEGGHREAVRPRPRLGARAQPDHRRRAAGAAGFPHRPLPRQGDGAGPAGPAVRQRDLRAAVEPQLRRVRADHGGRGRRRGLARRLLRTERLPARHDPEPHDAAPRAHRDGAAGVARRRGDPRREGEAAPGHPAAGARARAATWRAAQYAAGLVGGRPVPGYREEDGISPQSATETYAALRLAINNWRWAGVPFYLRSGKRLARRVTEIAIQFKCPPGTLFAEGGAVRPRGQHARVPDPAGRGQHGAAQRQDSRPRDAHAAGEDAFPLRRPPSARTRPRPTSAWCSTR